MPRCGLSQPCACILGAGPQCFKFKCADWFSSSGLSERWENLNALQRRKYQFLLKSADVNLKDLMTVGALYAFLDRFEFKNIQIQDLSEPGFSGFADYVQKTLNSKASDDQVQGSKLVSF